MTLPIHYTTGRSPLGAVLVAGSERGLVWVALGEDPRALFAELAGAHPGAKPDDPGSLDDALRQVIARIESPTTPMTASSPRLDLDAVPATPFQRRIWAALLAIPTGQTTTYAALAASLGLPNTAVRAVGQAVAKNPIAVLIPCHRVIRSDGGLAGYRWGLARKVGLLEREGAVLPALALDLSP